MRISGRELSAHGEGANLRSKKPLTHLESKYESQAIRYKGRKICRRNGRLAVGTQHSSCNEAGEHSTDWQYHLINYIKEYESGKGKQHPVGMTYQGKGGTNDECST